MKLSKILAYSMTSAILCLIAEPAQAVDVWITTGDKSQLLKQQTDVLFQPGAGSGGIPVSVVPTTTF